MTAGTYHIFLLNNYVIFSKHFSVSGKLRFGLSHPTVSALLRELPNADKCPLTSWNSIMSTPSSITSTPPSSTQQSSEPPIYSRKRKYFHADEANSSDEASNETATKGVYIAMR
jgi:hypothetical protein